MEEAPNDFTWDESLSAEVKLKAAIHKKNGVKRKITYKFMFIRDSKQYAWKMQDVLTEA